MDKGIEFARLQIKNAYEISKEIEELNYLTNKINKVYNRVKNTEKTGDFLRYIKKFSKEDHRDKTDFLIFKQYNIITLEEMYEFINNNFSNEKNNFSLINQLKIGLKYSNYDLMNYFLCSEQGGMRRGKRTNSLVLVTDHTKPLYSDIWDEEDVLHYTGMGQKGDMRLLYSQNKTLYESDSNGVDLHLFEVYDSKSLKKYIYRGIVKLVGKPYTEIKPDININPRKVWIFPIKPISKSFINEEEILKAEKAAEKSAKKLSDIDLKKSIRIIDHNITNQRKIISTAYNRNAAVKEYTKRRANGVCELCKKEAPFYTKDGQPYLEVHHIITLAKSGPDSVVNTVALCPNCHRKIHYAETKEDKDLLVKLILNDLLFEDDLLEVANKLFK